MVMIFSFIIGFLDICKKKSKIVFTLTFVFLWIIMSFTYGNADESVYISRYVNPEAWVDQTEFLYMMIIKISLFLGISFQMFKVIVVLIQLLLMSNTILKYAKFPNLILLLYFIFPFTIDVAQMRNALATSIFIFSLQFLLKKETHNMNKKKFITRNDIFYIIGIIIASLIHTASIAWLLLLIGKKLDLKKVVIFTFGFNVLFSFIIKPSFIVFIASKFGATLRIGAYTSSAYETTRNLYYMSTMFRVTVYAAIIIAICVALLKNNRKNNDDIYLLLKMQIVILCIYTIIINYTNEIYRMQVGLSMISYIIITNCLNPTYEGKRKTSLYNLFICSSLCIFAVINLYLLVLGNENINSVFYPVFENNAFFDFFSCLI